MSTITLNNAARGARSMPYASSSPQMATSARVPQKTAHAAQSMPHARSPQMAVSPQKTTHAARPARAELHYKPLFVPLCRTAWNKASCADVLSGLFAANLMILVLFGAVVAFIAAGDVACGRVCFYLLTWGSEVVLLAAGSLWVVLNLVQHAAEAGCWMVRRTFSWQPRQRFDLRYS